MTKTKYCLLRFSMLIVAALLCSFVLSPVVGSGYVIGEDSVPDLWGGGDPCAKPNGSTCRKCCVKQLCNQTFDPTCDTHSANKTKCLESGTYETIPKPDITGYSCKDTTNPADSCTKSNWGTCADRCKCYWLKVGSCCGANTNDCYDRDAYLNCT